MLSFDLVLFTSICIFKKLRFGLKIVLHVGFLGGHWVVWLWGPQTLFLFNNSPSVASVTFCSQLPSQTERNTCFFSGWYFRWFQFRAYFPQPPSLSYSVHENRAWILLFCDMWICLDFCVKIWVLCMLCIHCFQPENVLCGLLKAFIDTVWHTADLVGADFEWHLAFC